MAAIATAKTAIENKNNNNIRSKIWPVRSFRTELMIYRSEKCTRHAYFISYSEAHTYKGIVWTKKK